MSDVQNAIEELVNEQVDSRIEESISDNHEIQSMRGEIDDLQNKVDGLVDNPDDLVDAVMLELTRKLCGGLDGDYVMVKKSYLKTLQAKGEEG
jgi:hypothetical protein